MNRWTNWHASEVVAGIAYRSEYGSSGYIQHDRQFMHEIVVQPAAACSEAMGPAE